ncbi:MAG TPA: SHD1 domain-containing protein [Thermoguttaceae bacterium]
MFKKLVNVLIVVVLSANVWVLKAVSCYGQDYGSAEAARIISETQRRYEYDKYQEHKKEILRKKLLESGKKLFGTHKLWEEAISTKSPLLGPLSKKDPPDFQVGDWGFITSGLITISQVSKKEYLVLCKYKGDRILLIRGMDMTNITDDVEFILQHPVVIRTTYSYVAADGAKNTVLVAESNDAALEDAIAKTRDEEAKRQAVAESKHIEEKKILQAENEKRRKEATRIWTDSTSGYTIKAEFLSSTAGKVKLKKEDGSIATISLDKLSKEDQKWIRNRARGKQ